MKTYQIHLIRHGLTDGALGGKYIGHTDEPLCEQGIMQLRELMRDCEYPHAQVVISSPLTRCVQTARIIYEDSEPAKLDGFTECDFGEFEGLTAAQLEPYPEFGEWLKGGEDAAAPNGESNLHFKERVCGTFIKLVEGLLKTGTTSAAVVTHGGVIMTLLAAFGIPELPMHEWLTPCGCGYTVRITPSVWTRVYKFEVIREIPDESGTGIQEEE